MLDCSFLKQANAETDPVSIALENYIVTNDNGKEEEQGPCYNKIEPFEIVQPLVVNPPSGSKTVLIPLSLSLIVDKLKTVFDDQDKSFDEIQDTYFCEQQISVSLQSSLSAKQSCCLHLLSKLF